VESFSADAFELLMQYQWPGNVRELRTAIEHAVVLCRGDKITVRDLPASLREAVGQAPAEKDPRRLLARDDLTAQEAERELIVRALKATNGHRTLAAKRLGMSRRTFHRRLHLHHLEEI
jgi:transcriptional regulator of acetoin/glycerol metabolism